MCEEDINYEEHKNVNILNHNETNINNAIYDLKHQPSQKEFKKMDSNKTFKTLNSSCKKLNNIMN
jgi:hypothetical protein